jgi:cytochrome c oxidase subunit 4
MTSTKLYAVIYVVLFVMATAQVLVEFAGLNYWLAFGVILALSAVKALLVAGYYQHLLFEPRSVSYLMLGGLVAALGLTLAAAYSIL